MPLYPFAGRWPSVDPSAFVHPDAVIIGDVAIGPESSIWPGVVIRGDVNHIRIGARTNIQDGSVLHVTRGKPDKPAGLPLILGDDITIGHRVTLHACTLKSGCMVGMGATVMDGVVIESGAMVAAGAMVTPGKQIATGELWMGSPAKLARPIRATEAQEITATTQNYIKLGQHYLQELAALNHG
ncbi:transferase hexapeptide repeat [Magnetococcus marinus MC-1]|uniref:Transferase hexapeptide repeat n=1 Tax=Magnetococcus marinus (strain ATCC BAA-1437 / JCM 17883 / MC-1) TaxID=156889 RepID=A0L7L3_MAGMM|nr:gamma carbonic anhydrase family protein [Magnetococcus marinus]ABK43956.1 transferase hexapeptide repeat [Magnetococcus marinus MC-1]